MISWQVVDEKQRRWHLLSWHGTYWVFEYPINLGHWHIQFCDLYLAGTYDMAAAIAFAEWHNDFHGGRFEEPDA